MNMIEEQHRTVLGQKDQEIQNLIGQVTEI